MRTICTLLLLLIIPAFAISQSTFVGQLGGYDSEVPYGMITDHAKNIIVCGVFDDTIDFDMSSSVFQLSNNNTYGGFVAKYDTLGVLIWAKQVGTLINDVEVDEFDNIYLIGTLFGTSDVDPSFATSNLTSNGLNDGVLIKLDPAGNFVSAIHLGGSGDDGLASIKSNDDGEIYVSGSFTDTVDFDPSGSSFELAPSNMGTFYFCNTGFIAKYDYDLNFIWVRRIAEPGLITVHKGDPANEYFILSTTGNSATSTDSADFDPAPLSFVNPVPDSLPDAHWMGLIKYNNYGDFVWSKFYRTFGSLGSSSLGFYDVKMDENQNIISTGMFTMPFNAYPSNDISLEPFVTLTGQPDGFLIKIDSSANLIWQKRFGSDYGADYGSCMTLDNNNNIHLTGAFIDTAEFNDGGISETLIANSVNVLNAFDYDMFVVGYDSNGNYLYKGQVGGNGADGGLKIVNAGSKIGIIGIFADTADCDPFVGNTTLSSLGFQDIFINFYENNFSTAIASEINKDEILNVYPNPFSSIITLEFKTQEVKEASILIFDQTGRQVVNGAEHVQLYENNTIVLNLDHLTAGIYFCKLNTPAINKTLKLVKY